MPQEAEKLKLWVTLNKEAKISRKEIESLQEALS
jgi:hypothetical protein